MLRACLVAATLLFANIVQAQKAQRIELDIIGRYDKHADYTTRYFDRSYTNETELWGKSLGLNFNYFHPIGKQFNFKAGIGYYILGINKIRQATPFGTIASGRSIDYHHPSGILLLFATNKYHYDNLALTIGMDYNKSASKKMSFVAGADLAYLYTFSQIYHIPYEDIRYKTSNGKTLGFTINAFLGTCHKFNKGNYYLGPKLIIPVYQQLYGDQVFGENGSLKMTRWLDGIGFSIAVGKYL